MGFIKKIILINNVKNKLVFAHITIKEGYILLCLDVNLGMNKPLKTNKCKFYVIFI